MYAKFPSTLLAATLLVGLATPVTLPAYADTALKGEVSEVYIPEGLAEEAAKLTDAAYDRDETAQTIEEMVKKFSTMKHKAVVASKEFMYCMVPYRGFGPSKYGSQILLEQVKKVNTLAGAQYLKQRTMDEMHTKVVGSLLQISEGLDCQDQERKQQLLSSAQTNLTELVGDEKAAEVVRLMTGWSKGLSVPTTAFQKKSWDIGSLQHNVRAATGVAVSTDPIFKAVADKLKKYNRGKGMTALSSAVESTAAIASFMAPGFAIPFAIDAANALFVTSTGGCEQTKMVNELYYAKRMESRWKRLNEESQLALASYQMALEHKNPTMLACSESFIQQLIGPEYGKKLLGDLVLPPQQVATDHAADIPQTADADKDSDKATDNHGDKTELASKPSSTGDQDLDRALAETDELWADAEKARKEQEQQKADKAGHDKASKHKQDGDKDSPDKNGSRKSASSESVKYE